MSQKSKSPQEVAREQTLAISEHLYLAGRDGLTAEQLAGAAKFPVEIVRKRLHAGGPNCANPEWRRFTFDRLTNRWALTLGGEQVLKRSGRATTRPGRRRIA
ncbi:hypothetical protein GobsT_31230 [Gemmata obscuriglobus]|uniref:Uncharacterized protein n=1 Tax=Gemmata obscuriglobus TaxID=114 RepID=A0A2Z3GZ17_9BACT|nr:hypothetical protein [Gemmata obscuriglobus]AWM38688.1 hypothetical protein C1280_17975 [Gemmata obscuriglobus]QEG28346.1 hypothetical protein GobsT_31230 [Gemmata obscuriglobus]VTS06229.1 unnamed protein product [Gemmata obscuriglobus UQM 2246]